ncbi:MAG: RDD family protein [Methylophilaceae bacterium]|nr:RDD family protein [Methylophilaceae bacterium]
MLRYFAACLYEALLLAAVLFAAAFLFVLSFGSAVEPPRRYFFQGYLLVVMAVYFSWFWTHGGQTLAMKTWRLRLVRVDGGCVSLPIALLRFVIAVLGLVLMGVGWWWMLFDRENCTLHDRLCGTRLVKS